MLTDTTKQHEKNGCDISIGSDKIQFESDFCLEKLLMSDKIIVSEGDYNKMFFFCNCHLVFGCIIFIHMMKIIGGADSFFYSDWAIIYL